MTIRFSSAFQAGTVPERRQSLIVFIPVSSAAQAASFPGKRGIRPVGRIVENLVTGLTLGSLYALISIGMTMVYGLIKILHVAHAAFMCWGHSWGLLFTL